MLDHALDYLYTSAISEPHSTPINESVQPPPHSQVISEYLNRTRAMDGLPPLSRSATELLHSRSLK